MNSSFEDFKKELQHFLQEDQIIEGSSQIAEMFLKEKRGNFSSSCAAILLPKDAIEAQKIVLLCNQYQIKIVPQSGNTGLVGGSVACGDQIILSAKKLNQIQPIEENSYTLVAGAGVILKNAQEYCRAHNLLFSLSLPSEEKCCLGGNLASNAGGISVLKYGNIRDITLGLEVVLPSGEIYSDLNILRKRNIGSDLKHLFIGSEGLLGFITAASFKIFPLPKKNINLLVAIEDIFALENLFDNLYVKFSNWMSAFEIFNNAALAVSLKHFKDSFFPLKIDKKWYAIASFELNEEDKRFEDHVKNMVYELANKLCQDCYIGDSSNLWDVRFKMPDAQRLEGESLKHDISIPLGRMGDFITKVLPQVETTDRQFQAVIFGHMGDGNLHLNIAKGQYNDYSLKESKAKLKSIIVNEAMKFNGTFSAEHGVGLVHKEEFAKFYCDNQLKNLKLIKELFDINNIFNPHKII